MAYTDVFGGTTIYPSQVSFLSLALSSEDVVLEWPLENSGTSDPAARIIAVNSANSRSIVLPDATQTGPGQTILFFNLDASSSSFTVKDNSGGTVATIGVGEQWQVILSDNSTAAGTWLVLCYGASTATAQPSALAGYGITVISNQLSQSMPVTTFNSSPRTLLLSDRASLMAWTGSGAATLDLMSAVTAGANFFIAVRNDGGGVLTVDPSGSETIDSDTMLALQPGDSAILVTDGIAWYTVGLGRQAVFAFDYTSIDLTGQSSPYALSGSELNRIAYDFVGTLSGNIDIVVPPTYQQYWITNSTTGAYTLTFKTASGSGISINQGASNIVYCNGSDVVDADTASLSVPLTASQGGTGQTSYAIGDILYASGTTTLSKLADTATGNVLLSGGVGVAPSYGKVDLSTAITGQLPLATNVSGTLAVANGGTGQTSYANGQILIGNTTGNTLTLTTLTAGTGISVTNGAGSITVSADVPQAAANNSVYFGTSAGGTSGSFNASFGVQAGANLNGSSQQNTLGGYQAGLAITSGDGHTFVGYQTGKSAVTSTGSSFFGYQAGLICTGNTNTFIGNGAGISMTTGTLNVIVGGYSGSGSTTASNLAVFADGAGTRRFWHDATDAYVSHNTTANAANAVLDSGTSKLQRSTSSIRYKRDVEPLQTQYADAVVLGLEPIWYRSRCSGDPQDWSYWGFSAEQAAEIDPRIVNWEPHEDDWTEPDDNGERFPIENARMVPGGVAYDRLTVHLVSYIQRLEARVAALEAASG